VKMKKQTDEQKTVYDDTQGPILQDHKTSSKIILLPFSGARYDIIPRTTHKHDVSLNSSMEELYELFFDTATLSVKECLLSMYGVELDSNTIHPATICFDEHLEKKKFFSKISNTHYSKKLGLKYTESTFEEICGRLLNELPEDMNSLYELLHMIAMKLDILICLWYQPEKPHKGYWIYVYPRKGIMKNKKHEFIVRNVNRPVFLYLNFRKTPIEIRAVKPNAAYFKLILSQMKVDLHFMEEKKDVVDEYWKQMGNNKHIEMNYTNASPSSSFASAKSSWTPSQKDTEQKQRHKSPPQFVSAKSSWTPSPETMHRENIELDFEIKMTRKRISAQKKIHDLQQRIHNLIENEKKTTKDIATRHDEILKTNRKHKQKIDNDLAKTNKELQESKRELRGIQEQNRKSIRELDTYEDLKRNSSKRLNETYRIQTELEHDLNILFKKKQETEHQLKTRLENKPKMEHNINSKQTSSTKQKQTSSTKQKQTSSTKPVVRKPRVDPVLESTGLTGTYWKSINTKKRNKSRER